jgi:hypothetical protein
MKFSSIAITALVSALIASPVLAQSSLAPRVSGHGPKVTGGSGAVSGLRAAPRRHGFNRNSGNRFGFGSGFVFGDAKGFGIGEDRNGGHDRRWRGRHPGRHGDRDDGFIGYGGVGYEGYYGSYASTPPAPDEFGFFGNGGEATLVDGHAVYDYDRSYPYEHYRAPRREKAAATGSSTRRATASGCETEWVPDGRGGGDVPVRICRR